MTQVDVAGARSEATSGPEASTAWLRLPCCDAEVHPVAIERHEGGRLEISAPRSPHAEAIEIPDSDEIVSFSWSFGGGLFALSCRVEAVSTSERWILSVEGGGEFVHRRRHVRVATKAPVQLLDHRRDVAVPGTLLDMSEGGIRCSFDEWLFEGDDDAYRIAVQLNGSVLVVEATPMWSGGDNTGKVYVGFEFGALHHSILARIRSHVTATLAQSSDRLA